MESKGPPTVLRPGIGAEFGFCSFLCLPKETNQRKGTPDKVFDCGIAFQNSFITQTAPGEINAAHLFGGSRLKPLLLNSKFCANDGQKPPAGRAHHASIAINSIFKLYCFFGSLPMH
jgi:hypothetical protein